MTETEMIVVMCALPVEFAADRLAAQLVERSLAACVQIGPGVTSTYRWKGAIETSTERLILIKTRRELFARVEAAVREVHPYDVPEIIALSVTAAHAPYLAWIAGETDSGRTGLLRLPAERNGASQ